MEITFDPAKKRKKYQRGGLSFESVSGFDFETATFKIGDRHDYGEIRYQAPGRVQGSLHALVYAETENGIRVISFRKANMREVKDYEQATKP